MIAKGILLFKDKYLQPQMYIIMLNANYIFQKKRKQYDCFNYNCYENLISQDVLAMAECF